MVIHARTHMSALERYTVSKQEPKRSGCADPTRYMKSHIPLRRLIAPENFFFLVDKTAARKMTSVPGSCLGALPH
jgi:hypothetical protein